MEIIGIICEYNPLHLGHVRQIAEIRKAFPGSAIVCLMSGNYVQRGAPAIFDKSLRARAAVACGADLVLELPVQYVLSSAEGFAAGGVDILSPFCDHLCFGTETGSAKSLMSTAEALLSDSFSDAIRPHLDAGLSFPSARQKALESIGISGALLSRPNDILAVEYCKAILRCHSKMKPFPVIRPGNYHDFIPDSQNPSATSIRAAILESRPWIQYIPRDVRNLAETAPVHDLKSGERAILGKLRRMTEEEYASVPYGSEGLWRKLMHAAREESTLEAVASAVKSKRYTRTRIDRMILCAFLELTESALSITPAYIRVLALTDSGRSVLKTARKFRQFLNAGEIPHDPGWEQERRLGDLYELFCTDIPGKPGIEIRRRIYYQKQEES